MDKTKQKRLEAAGWRVGDAADFLGLTSEEAAFVEDGFDVFFGHAWAPGRAGEE